MNATSADCSLLVVSCDKYADAWPMFFHLLWKMWPDCPFPVFLGTNSLSYADSRITMIHIGEDRSWCDNLQVMLARIETPYVLVMLDDYFILETVDNQRIVETLGAVKKLNGAYAILNATMPPPDRLIEEYPWLGEMDPGFPYRCSLNPAFWRRDVLSELLMTGESCWDFEHFGSIRSGSRSERFLRNTTILLRIDKNGIWRGVWCRPTVKLAKKLGISLDMQRRPQMGWLPHLKRTLLRYPNKLSYCIPWRTRRKLGDFLRRLKLLAPRPDAPAPK
jgi:hypothetical protein